MALNDLFELVVNQSLAGNKLVNRFILREGAVGSSTPEIDIMNDWMAMVKPALAPCQVTSLVYDSYSCRKVYPSVGPTYLLADGNPGTISADPEPAQCCAVVAFYSSLYTRKGRGRAHISGLDETNVKDGLLTDAYRSLLITFADAIVTGLTHWYFTVADPALGTFSDIIAHQIRTHTYTLRSRRIGSQ